METIKLSEFDWIKSNSDLFKKHLYAHHDFIGKGITHININITFPQSHLILLELCKAKKPFKWFTINGGSDRRVIDYASVHFTKYFANNKAEHEPKEVRLIKSEYEKDYLSKVIADTIKKVKRDNILKEILQ